MDWLTEFPLDRALLFAVLGAVVAAIRYGTYLWSIYKGETRPHIFSWITWGVMVSIAAAAQFDLGGGWSAWLLVTVASFCYLIALLSLKVGEKRITRSDWIAFIIALISIPVWVVTKNPMAALIVLVIVDIASYYPTFRKCWHDPYSEAAFSYFWAGLRYFFAMLAVPEFTVELMFYPAWLMFADWAFMMYVYARRWALAHHTRRNKA